MVLIWQSQLLQSHLLHALFYVLLWNIEYTRDVEWGDRFEVPFCTFFAYEVGDVLLKQFHFTPLLSHLRSK